MLKHVTITGADDTVSPADLIMITQRFPFVEWGILFSYDKQPQGIRYPSAKWITELVRLRSSSPVPINMSLHLCGIAAKQILFGDDQLLANMAAPIFGAFNRIQLNAKDYAMLSPDGIRLIKNYHTKEFIFQHREGDYIDWLKDFGVTNFSVLFDGSGGRGISPEQWRRPIAGVRCGYAGGLGPDNLEAELDKIHSRTIAPWNTDGHPYWIDMETKVRSVGLMSLLKPKHYESLKEYGGDSTVDIFDVNKVRECLKIAVTKTDLLCQK